MHLQLLDFSRHAIHVMGCSFWKAEKLNEQMTEKMAQWEKDAGALSLAMTMFQNTI